MVTHWTAARQGNGAVRPISWTALDAATLPFQSGLLPIGARRVLQLMRQHATLTLMLIIPLWLCLFDFTRPLAMPNEGRYTEIARWMVVSGDWIVPRIDGLPFLHKPPLYYWLEALCISLSGVSLFGARFVVWVSALLACGASWFIVRRYATAAAANWTVVVLATCPLFFSAAQYANLDTLQAGLIATTLGFAVHATEAEADRNSWAWLAAYASAALALLAKGLAGVVLPAAIYVVWQLWNGNVRAIPRAISPLGILLFLAIAAPWFLLMEQRFPGFIGYIVGVQHIDRYLGDQFSDQYGLYFYPLILSLGTLPWLVPAVASRLRALPSHSNARLWRLGASWLLVMLAFYSVPKSKLVDYTYSFYPAFALLLGPWVASWRLRLPAALLAAFACLSFGLIAPGMLKYGPVKAAHAIKADIRPEDEIVFVRQWDYDAAVELNSSKPAWIVGDWSASSRSLPDSLRRQLIEARDFDPASGGVLIDKQGLDRLLDRTERAWIFVVDGEGGGYRLDHLPVCARDRYWTVLLYEKAAVAPPVRCELSSPGRRPG